MTKHEPQSEEAKRYTAWANEFSAKHGSPKKRIDWMVDNLEKIVPQLQQQQGLDDLLDWDYTRWRKGLHGK